MDRHVIKGRGEHREKYLCYARKAGLPPSDEYVWLPEQRKAARWEDSRYSGRTYATEVARKYNGYFVRLVAPITITSDVVDDLRAYISEHAEGAEERLPCYWFDDDDFISVSEDYCLECAKKLVDEKYAADPKRFEELYGECEDDEGRYREAIHGGFDIEHDSPPYCETCGVQLRGSLTEYGADEQIDAYTNSCSPDPKDAEGWAHLDAALVNVSDDDPRWRAIQRVVASSREEEKREEERLTAIAASPGMPEARASLLGVLEARAVQKAPEPSYRLWEELQRYRKLPFDERCTPTRETAAWEKRLLEEARAFLAHFGYVETGSHCFRGPCGHYYWPFVVQAEQYRLWRSPAFVEGEAHGIAPGHEAANPYAEGSEERAQWSAGWGFGFTSRNGGER